MRPETSPRPGMPAGGGGGGGGGGGVFIIIIKSTKVQNPRRQLCAGALDVRTVSMHCCNLISQPGHGPTYLARHTLLTARLGPMAYL